MLSGQLPPPNWYPDPHVPQQVRWWDGKSWTPHCQPVLAPVEPLDSAKPGWRRRRPGQDSAKADADGNLLEAIEAADQALRQRLTVWRGDTDAKRKGLEVAHGQYRKKVKAARQAAKRAATPNRLAGGALLPVTVNETHVVIGRQQFPLQSGINATVDSSGNISRSRRYTATRTVMFGVGTLFMPYATKHDDRELFLLIEAPQWAQVVKLDAKKQVAARKLAQSIILASNNAEQHQQRFAARRAEGEAALRAAISDIEMISTAEQALRDVDAPRLLRWSRTYRPPLTPRGKRRPEGLGEHASCSPRRPLPSGSHWRSLPAPTYGVLGQPRNSGLLAVSCG